MKKSNIVLGSVLGLTAFSVLGASVFAAESIGTVTGNDGDTLDMVRMEAEVVDVNGSQVTIKDTETGDTYDTSFGPSWYLDVEEGQTVTVEGVITTGENDNNHNFQTTTVDDTEVRAEFEGKPSWAGSNGSGQGTGDHSGAGQGQGQMNKGQGGSNYSDSNGDGVCDNQ